MIVKTKSYKRPNYAKMLDYIINDDDRLYDENGKSFLIAHNLKGKKLDEWVLQYKYNEQFRKRKRKDSILFTQEILSWHKDDAKQITLEKMEAMAREYIRLRNPKGIYVVAPHFDKSHYHIHICASGLEYHTGKAMRMSKAEFAKLKTDIQEYQKEHFPELSKSIVAHGKGKKSNEKEYQLKRRTGRESNKEQIIGMLKTCYKAADSTEDFYEKLKQSGLAIYERADKITGIVFGKHKFRFNRLGYTEERLNELDKTITRTKELHTTREKTNKRNIHRNR